MATLILTTVGNAVGGPLGGAIGGLLGRQIDQRLLGPKGRQGPRLGDLSVQSSSYGSPIPKLFGASRVAGTVIWSTDLRETRRKVSAGKGQPKSTVYSYSASFAVALSARSIARVGRIWADGNLLRGAAGDFKTKTGFRLYRGEEDQPVDPLIASVEGMGRAPAYRGLAYAVFEDFELGDYGNRIPSLSVEVFADEGAVSVGRMVTELGMTCDSPALIGGFAAAGDSLRALTETLAPLYPLRLRDDGDALRLSEDGRVATAPDARDLGASADGSPAARIARERRASGALPGLVTVAHYAPERDYQQGLQRVPAGGAGRTLRIDLPATLDAGAIKQRAALALRRMRGEGDRATLSLPWRALDLVPGSIVPLPGMAGAWRVTAVTLDRMVVEAALVREPGPMGAVAPADHGRALAQDDAPHGPTRLELLDIASPDGALHVPRIAVAAAGMSPGWRRAPLLLSVDDGLSWQEAGPTAAPAVMGRALDVLPPASPHLFDEAGSVEVELLHDGMDLSDASHASLLAGANLAMIGDETIQFRRAVPLGRNRYRLNGLIRGKGGTEWASSNHAPGERFVLLDADALAWIDVPPGTPSLRILPAGVADEGALASVVEAPGRATRPLAPVHVRAESLADGGRELRWIRRSRALADWSAPLDEPEERYLVAVGNTPGIEVTEPRFAIAPGGGPLSVSVHQLGRFGPSPEATLSIPN